MDVVAVADALLETFQKIDWNESSLRTTENILTTLAANNASVYLTEANSRFSKTLIPCMVYLGVLMVVGIVGNSLVCYVFGFRLKRSTQNFFILLLAVFDLLSCTIALPAEIVDLDYFLMFESAALCKIMRFVNAFASMSSICTLIVIASDRYRRVRNHLKSQITSRHARLSLIPIVLASLMFSTPTLYVYGLRTVDSGFSRLTGLDCSISDKAKHTIVPLVYNGVLFVSFIVLATSLVIMYSMIMRALREHSRTQRKIYVSRSSTTNVSLTETNDSPTEPYQGDEDSISVSYSRSSVLSMNQKNVEQLSTSPCSHFRDNRSDTNRKDHVDGYRNVPPSIDAHETGMLHNNQTTSQSEDVINEVVDIQQSSLVSRLNVEIFVDAGGSKIFVKPETVATTDQVLELVVYKVPERTYGSQSSLDLVNQVLDKVNNVTNIVPNNSAMEGEELKYDSDDMPKVSPTNMTSLSHNHDGPHSVIQDSSREDSARNRSSFVFGMDDVKVLTRCDRERKDELREKAENRQSNSAGSGRSLTQHVSFQVDGPALDSAVLLDGKTTSHVSVSDHEQVISQRSVLNDPEDQPQGHLTTRCQFPADGELKQENYESQVLKQENDESQVLKQENFESQALKQNNYERQALEQENYESQTLKQENYEREALNHKKHTKCAKESPRNRNISRKTTIIAFVVTLVFILSFVPHLCLQVAHLIYEGFDEKLEGAPLVLFNTFLRSYFINSVANPVIYGVLNDKFRDEMKLVVRRLRCCNR